MRSHFNFGVFIVLPQDVLSAAAGEGWKWGWNSENWNLITEMEFWLTSCVLFPFIFEFCCVLLFKTLVSTVRHLILLRRLMGWHRWLYNCVIVQLCWTAYIFRHNRKEYLNNDSFVMLVRWVSHLHEISRLRQQSLKIPHSSSTDLWAVAYVGSCVD
jgi:hypothetical protein